MGFFFASNLAAVGTMRPMNLILVGFVLVFSKWKNLIPERPLPDKTPFLAEKDYGLNWSRCRLKPTGTQGSFRIQEI